MYLLSFVCFVFYIAMAVIKKPNLKNPILLAKLSKGMGHNYYGEPAWPNDLLYILFSRYLLIHDDCL